jgi:PIN domain nuclease of toxin-antitoxin system
MELSVAARRAIADRANDRFVSIVALWEIAIKMSIGKLTFVDDISQAIDDLALASLPIEIEHVRRVRVLPFIHRDPFDRMMIAQAMEEGLTIITRDRRMRLYDVPVLEA